MRGCMYVRAHIKTYALGVNNQKTNSQNMRAYNLAVSFEVACVFVRMKKKYCESERNFCKPVHQNLQDFTMPIP